MTEGGALMPTNSIDYVVFTRVNTPHSVPFCEFTAVYNSVQRTRRKVLIYSCEEKTGETILS